MLEIKNGDALSISNLAELTGLCVSSINTYMCRSEFRKFDAPPATGKRTTRNSRKFIVSKEFMSTLYDILANSKKGKRKLGTIHRLMKEL